jgi:hypothetical protein
MLPFPGAPAEMSGDPEIVLHDETLTGFPPGYFFLAGPPIDLHWKL